MKRTNTVLRPLFSLAAAVLLAGSLLACDLSEEPDQDDELIETTRTTEEIDLTVSDTDGCEVGNLRYVPFSSCYRVCVGKPKTSRFLMGTRSCGDDDLSLDNQCFVETPDGIQSCQ